MSSLLSVRLSDELFQAMRSNAQDLHLSQTDYVRQAIEKMNEEINQLNLERKLKQVSLRVRHQSQQVNTEFSRIEHDPNA